MANTRIKDLTNTAVTVPSDAYIAIDGSANGTAKIARDDLRQDTADAIAAAPSTYNLAPLTSGSVDVDKGGTGSTTVDGAKTTLQIPNVGTAANEVPVNGMLGDLAFQSSAGVVVDDLTVDGHFTGAVGKPMPVNGPSMRFDGVDDEISFAASVGSPFSFTNGTDDLAFSVAGWCKLASGWNTDQRTLLSKFDNTSSLREWRVYLDTNYRIYAEKRPLSSSDLIRTVSNVLSDIDDKWMHICVVWLPAGPNSADAFTSAKAYIYVNGKLSVDVQSEQPSGPYVGMTDTAGDIRIGSRQSFDYWDGEIRDVKLFNKELSAAEVKEVYSNGQLGDSFAQSTGAITYAQDSSPSGEWSATNLTASDEAGPISGRSNILKLLVSAGSSTHYIQDAKLTSEKRFKVTGSYYIPSSNSNADGFRVGTNTSTDLGTSISSATLDAWTDFSCELTSNAVNLRISLSDGGSQTFNDSGGNDVAYFDNIRVTQIGAVLDARAEQFDTSTGKLYDLSGNDFVGTQSGGVSLLGREFLIPERGIFTPTIYYQNPTGLSTSYTTQSGNYVRMGDLVTIQIKLTWTVTGTPVNDNLGVRGIPFQPAREDSLACHDSQGQTALVTTNASNDIMYCLSNSLASNLADNVGAGTHTIYISGTYQIQ